MADVTAEHTLGILSTIEIKYSSESSSQVCGRSSHKIGATVGCFAFTLLSSSSQTSSMGFQSGDCAVLKLPLVFFCPEVVLAQIGLVFWVIILLSDKSLTN